MLCGSYLLKEYELCHDQLRYYDTRHANILKYFFSLTSAVATAQFAVFQFFEGITNTFFACQAFLAIVVFVSTLLFYFMMLQNRLYFVYTARQINALRGYFMEHEAGNFVDNQLYTKVKFSAFKITSVHTFQLFGAAFVSAMYVSLAIYAFCRAVDQSCSFYVPFLIGLLILVIEISVGIKYLSSASGKTADAAIHGNCQ